jgi:hypothetical protein
MKDETVSEETRTEYWRKMEELNQQIAELEERRDALVLSDEDREFYASKHSPLMRELCKAAIKSSGAVNSIKTLTLMDALSSDHPVGTRLRIVLPNSYKASDSF